MNALLCILLTFEVQQMDMKKRALSLLYQPLILLLQLWTTGQISESQNVVH